MLENTKAFIKVLIIFVYIIFYFVFFKLSSLFIFNKNRRVSWCCFTLRIMSKLVLKLLGTKVIKKGDFNNKRFFLVSNHCSYLDIIVYFSLIDVIFISKSEVAKWPLLGYIISQTNTIFINRKNKRSIIKVEKKIENYYKKGFGIIVFLEGTSTDNSTIKKLKSSLLKIPIQKNMTIIPAVIKYQSNNIKYPASHFICWWGDMEFLPHLFNLVKIGSFQANVHFLDKVNPLSNRKQLSEKIHKVMLEEF